jgi:AP-3 complex subunit sigma
MHAVLGEMIIGGVVIETNLERIVQGVRSQEGSKGRRTAVEGASAMGRTGIPGLSIPWR